MSDELMSLSEGKPTPRDPVLLLPFFQTPPLILTSVTGWRVGDGTIGPVLDHTLSLETGRYNKEERTGGA